MFEGSVLIVQLHSLCLRKETIKRLNGRYRIVVQPQNPRALQL